MILHLLITALLAYTAGIITGRSDLRREQRKAVSVVPASRLYVVWSNSEKPRKA